MFAPSFVALALAGSALAGPLKRFDGLTVDVKAPENVSSLDDLKLTTTVTNTNSEDVKILKVSVGISPILYNAHTPAVRHCPGPAPDALLRRQEGRHHHRLLGREGRDRAQRQRVHDHQVRRVGHRGAQP